MQKLHRTERYDWKHMTQWHRMSKRERERERESEREKKKKKEKERKTEKKKHKEIIREWNRNK
jgi:hypothetical protein